MQHFSYATTPCQKIALTLQLCHNVVLYDNATMLCQNFATIWASSQLAKGVAQFDSCMWSHLCWSLRGWGWSDCVFVFSVALLCHSNAALNRIEAFWDSDLIVPNCIVPTLRCIDDWSIIVFFPIALCYSMIHTRPFLKEYHQTAAQIIFLLFLEIPSGLF